LLWPDTEFITVNRGLVTVELKMNCALNVSKMNINETVDIMKYYLILCFFYKQMVIDFIYEKFME
jgi:hypothetical protein